VTTTNIRAVGLVLTVLNHFHLFPSGPLAQTAEGARRITYFVAQSNHGWPISPRWFLAGQPSGVGACLHKSSPHEQPGGHFPEFSPSRTKLWQGLLTLPPRRPKDRSPTRTPAGNLQSSRRPGCGDSLETRAVYIVILYIVTLSVNLLLRTVYDKILPEFLRTRLAHHAAVERLGTDDHAAAPQTSHPRPP